MYNPPNRKLASLVAAVICCIFIANLAAADDDDRHRHPGLRAKLDNLEQQVVQNTEAIATNAGNIADNFSASTANTADISALDARVTELEEAASQSERTYVDVDCLTNPDALLQPPISGRFPDDTTYQLTGACNGPLYVTGDRVHFVGVEPAAAIELPGYVADPSNAAVFGDGAHDLRIQNLLIDASDWATGTVANDTGAAGINARNAFVRVIDTRIVGGEIGINSFHGAVISTYGRVEVTGFVNHALSVGDQSVLTAHGPVAISTGVIDGSNLVAVDVYRAGTVDFREGVAINLPPENDPEEFYPTAISAVQQSHLLIRNNPLNDIQGTIRVYDKGSANIDGARISGEINLGVGSTLSMNSVTQTGDVELVMGSVLVMELSNLSDSSLEIGRNSHATMVFSTVGEIFAGAASSFGVESGQFGGAVILQGAIGSIFGADAHGDIRLFAPSNIAYQQDNGHGSLNGYTIYLCGNTSSVIDPVIATTGTISDGCLGDPFD